MSEAENWTLLTDVDDGTPALERFLAERVAAKLRSKWANTDRVVLEYKRGADWIESGAGIAMPEDRKTVTPESGARQLVTMARMLWEKHDEKRRIRLHAFGESQSGATSKDIWKMQVDFNEVDDEDEQPGTDQATRRAKGLEEVAGMETLRNATSDAHGFWKDAVGMTLKLAQQVVDLSEQTSQRQDALIESMRLEYQDRKEQREAAEREREDATHAKRVDKIFDRGLDLMSEMAKKYMVTKMGVSEDAFEGTFSSRLKAILARVKPEQKATCREVLGEEVWQILQDAAKGVSDDAFRQLTVQAAGKMPGNHNEVFGKLAAALGDQATVMALGKLLYEASN